MAGKIDAALKQYLSDADVLRELIDLAVPGLLEPGSELKPLNPEEISVLFDASLSKKQQLSAIARLRDLLASGVMVSDGWRDYVIIGAENQTHVDYAMPVRVLLENAIDYAWQAAMIAKKHREDRDRRHKAGKYSAQEQLQPDGEPLSSKELLSGLKEGDRLKPVITIVVYWSPEPWDGPRHLQDLMDLPPALRQLADDNSLIILEPCNLTPGQLRSGNTNLGLVLDLVKSSGSAACLQGKLASDERYTHMDATAAQVVAAVTGADLKDLLDHRKGDEIDMVKGLAEMVDNGREDTAAQFSRAMLELGIPMEVIAQKMNVTLEDVQRWIARSLPPTENEDLSIT